MSPHVRAAVALVAASALLTGCGREFSAPRNLDNACGLAEERPAYFRAMKDAERRWGVPVPVLMAMIHQESKFIGDARTPHQFVLGIIPVGRQSSAYGYSQALDGTWDEYRDETRNRGARRDRIDDATDFMGWYMTLSRDNLGIPLTDVRNQYLAYHEGRRGYATGSHLRKGWLLAVSDSVAARADIYFAQLASCGRL